MLKNGWIIFAVIFATYFPISFVKNIASLAIFSYLGLFSIIIAIVAILAKSSYIISIDYSASNKFNMASFD